MVKEESQKEEYLQTLQNEGERLNRLVGNVLDFSRLERQSPRLAKTRANLDDLLVEVASTWQGRCATAGKDLVLANLAGKDAELFTDVKIVEQILGNLIDNACKYSQGAADRRIWLRSGTAKRQSLFIEVEDRGPGVALPERRSIFRPFRRGKENAMAAGGVGLGLTLARRWARLLGGSLIIRPGQDDVGACFRLTLPSARI
jgi:signal transduction histidine kinase